MARALHSVTHLVSGLLLLATFVFAFPNSASASIVISNVPNTVTGGSTVSNTIYKAILFTTGS
jgi:hypothetical protein